MASDQDCLRPAFIRALAERLAQGSAVHLLGPHGQGRRRTLTDLRRCLPPAMPVLQANMRDYPQDPALMLADLASQAGFAGVDGLGTLLDRLTGRSDRSLIILHNLDELRPGRSGGYDAGFFETLNGIRERNTIALLCVSEHVPAGWPLHIDTLALPPLSAEQIQAELARRNPTLEAGDGADIARWLAAQSAPYTLLTQPGAWPGRHR